MSILIVFLDELCLRLTFLAIVVCKNQVLISLESTFSKQFGERTKKGRFCSIFWVKSRLPIPPNLKKTTKKTGTCPKATDVVLFCCETSQRHLGLETATQWLNQFFVTLYLNQCPIH